MTDISVAFKITRWLVFLAARDDQALEALRVKARGSQSEFALSEIADQNLDATDLQGFRPFVTETAFSSRKRTLNGVALKRLDGAR